MAEEGGRPSLESSRAAGKAMRKKIPRSRHAHCPFERRGRDVIGWLEASNRGRVPSLVPVRYGRMLASPFAFLRGAAVVMTRDLARTPVTGWRVQACGDAHLMNFGGFATPERHLVFDVNDFDETLPGPWEWDLKRLAASVAVAARTLKLSESACATATRASVSAYREAMASYANLGALEMWYQRIDATAIAELAPAVGKGSTEAPKAPVIGHRLSKLPVVAGRRRIEDDPPLIFHPRRGDRILDHVRQFMRQYQHTLLGDRRALLGRYQLEDVVVKVVGVGSVGLRCAVALFRARDDDLLFLQFKQARASVLEPFLGRSRYRNHGQRVVEGQRLMQSASDLFLGWSRIANLRADFYVRQLRDCKTTVDLDRMDRAQLVAYASHCGQALARAHAKAGDAAAISSYLGRGEAFDEAIERFAAAYVDRNEVDFATLEQAARAGRIPVEKA